MKGEEDKKRHEMRKTTQASFKRSCDSCICIFFLELLLIKNTNDCNEQHDVLVLFLEFLLYPCYIHMV